MIGPYDPYRAAVGHETMVSMTQSRHTVVVVASDAALIAQVVEAAGFEIVGTAANLMNGEHLVELLQPEFVVVNSDLPGYFGSSCLVGLQNLSLGSRFVLVTDEHPLPAETGEFGTFAVVQHDRLDDLSSKLRLVDDWLQTHPDKNVGRPDRRCGGDRRLIARWSNVGWERRRKNRRGRAQVIGETEPYRVTWVTQTSSP